jgi:hypothetical protein
MSPALCYAYAVHSLKGACQGRVLAIKGHSVRAIYFFSQCVADMEDFAMSRRTDGFTIARAIYITHGRDSLSASVSHNESQT